MSTPGTDVRSDSSIPESRRTDATAPEAAEASFVETALILGGKSLDEAHTPGAIARADGSSITLLTRVLISWPSAISPLSSSCSVRPGTHVGQRLGDQSLLVGRIQ